MDNVQIAPPEAKVFDSFSIRKIENGYIIEKYNAANPFTKTSFAKTKAELLEFISNSIIA